MNDMQHSDCKINNRLQWQSSVFFENIFKFSNVHFSSLNFSPCAMLGLLLGYYDNITQDCRSSSLQVQSKLCSDMCSAACLWWFFKHRFMVLALHSTHQGPVTSASADHSLPNGRNFRGLRWHCWHTLMRYAVAPTKPAVARRVLPVCGRQSAVDFVVCSSLLEPLAAVPACWIYIRGSWWERVLWLAVQPC